MASSNAKDTILNRLRSAKPFKWSVSPGNTGETDHFIVGADLVSAFEKELTEVSGEFKKAESLNEVAEEISAIAQQSKYDQINCTIPKLTGILNEKGIAKASEVNSPLAITRCEHLIASTGSAFATSTTGPGRKIYVAAETLVLIAHHSQLVPHIKDALNSLKNKKPYPSWAGLITGPSRTADIEKTLVLGAHGPRRLIVFLLPNDFN